jgi:hypothetical protein
MSDAIHLRGHHLLCILNWKGHGYTPEFTRNYDALVERIMNEGAPIRIIQGPDDICKVLDPETYEDYHCECADQALMDVKAIEGINAFFKSKNMSEWKADQDIFLNADLLEGMRAAFKTGKIRAGCQGCSFYDFCTDIAESDFEDTRLQLK